MFQDRKRHIENLKREIGLKFGRTIESAADFDSLSIDIGKNISETVSPSTLKRVFGYVKYDAEPRASTLSILARYVGYSGWSDFCRNYTPSEARNGIVYKDMQTRIRKLKMLVSFLSAACIILGLACVVLAVRLDKAMTPDRNTVESVPERTIMEMEDARYQEIRSDCIMKVKHLTDSVMALRGKLPLYRYVEICDSAYFHIAFDYMKPYINRTISEAFPDNDTLRTVHSNELFIECRDQAMVLINHISAEERRRAFDEKFGQ